MAKEVAKIAGIHAALLLPIIGMSVQTAILQSIGCRKKEHSMNEIERAIAEIIGTNYGESQCHRETMVLAAEALREQAEREKGCEYCNSQFGIASHHINEAGLQAGTKKIAIYCPMCGKAVGNEAIR